MAEEFTTGDLHGSSTSSKEVVTDKRLRFNYDLKQAPIGKKLILLTEGDIAVFGRLSGNPKRDVGFVAWFPMPVTDKTRKL